MSGASGDSPYGVKDMSGNIKEWVMDCYDGTYYETCSSTDCVDPINTDCTEDNEHVVRGGNALSQTMTALSIVSRRSGGIEIIPTENGFRCARNYSSE